jgi:VWFA-related protein
MLSSVGLAMRRPPIALLALLAVAVVTLHARQEAIFKGGTRTVAIYATVTGANNRLIPDLPRAAFTVLDNGKPQELSLFANDIQPITVVLLLDRSVSMRSNFGLVEQAAERFVQALQPTDKARIGSFSNRIQVDPRDFTSDRGELLNILRTELQEEGPTPLWNAVNVGITALLHQQGRRVVLVFTDGMDSPGGGYNNNSLKDVTKRAEEEDTMIYAIGLVPSVDGVAGGRRGRRGTFATPGAVVDRPDEGLPKIASATGGGYFELTSTNDLSATFGHVVDELHHQYALGFNPQVLDGKLHSIEVRVAQPGAAVRARQSYLARTER